MEQIVVLYTMKGCPFCVMMKEKLVEENVPFVERDIEKVSDEYDLFVSAVGGNEFVPAFMILETDGSTHNTKLFAPERDFNEIDDGVKIIKEHYERFNS